MEKMTGESLDLTQENIKRLKELFPEVLTEKKIDFDKLRLILGDEVETSPERYEFRWNGKNEVIKLSQTPSMGTLRPDKESSKNWDTTENLYIEGDNLEVLKLLQKSYFGKIKMIYIDPPYNTGTDFIYKDNFHDNIRNYKEITNQMTKANTETNGRFHTDWLNMMYPRLRLARNLLKEDGVIFISLDDNEIHNLRKICDEIFGENSFVTVIHVEMSTTQGMKVKSAKNGNIVKNAEYILVYSKNGHKNIAKTVLYDFRPEYDNHYTKMLGENNEVLNVKDVFLEQYPNEKINNLVDGYSSNISFKKFVKENVSKIFRYDKVTGFNFNEFEENVVTSVDRGGRKYTLQRKRNTLEQLMFLSDSFGQCNDFKSSEGLRKIRGDWWSDFYLDMGNISKEGDIVFKNGKKPKRLIKQLLQMTTDKDSIILDFFSGSATTGHAVMELNNEDNGNRKSIMIQLPESIDEKDEMYKAGYKNICEIGKERIRRAGDKIVSENGTKDLDIGFKVFKLDDSNIKTWDPNTKDLENTLFNSVQNLKEDRTQEDLLYELMLKMGIELTANIEEINVDGKIIYNIQSGGLVICLEDEITKEVINYIPTLKSPFMDMKVVFKEYGFKSDADKMNAIQNLKQHDIKDVRSV